MANENMAGEIKNGFQALGGGLKEAGRKRNLELVQKQGYVGFKNRAAAEALAQDPFYKGWTCIVENGEYRFFPPKDFVMPKNEPDPRILETYKENTTDPSYTYAIYINKSRNQEGCIEYRLVSQSRKTGEQKEIQHIEIPFDKKFVHEIIPSLYYYISEHLPGIDNIKGDKDSGFIFSIDNCNGNKRMALGGLTEEELRVLEEMKKYVDSKFLHLPEETTEIHK